MVDSRDKKEEDTRVIFIFWPGAVACYLLVVKQGSVWPAARGVVILQ